MRNDKTQAVTVRLDRELHRELTTISRVTGDSLRDIVESGLRRELASRLEDGHLAQAVATVRDYGSTRIET